MALQFDYIELYSGKDGSFLDHVALAPLLDSAAQSEFSLNWSDLDFNQTSNEFAQGLEESLLVNAFTSYWNQRLNQPGDKLYLKSVDSIVIVQKIGFQFIISNDLPFEAPNSNRGFQGIQFEKQ